MQLKNVILGFRRRIVGGFSSAIVYVLGDQPLGNQIVLLTEMEAHVGFDIASRRDISPISVERSKMKMEHGTEMLVTCLTRESDNSYLVNQLTRSHQESMLDAQSSAPRVKE